ncbi:esterase-like activity of phytase family protein [Actinomadura barringtoniae]|uniref:Esterase-like activity of phytase family protein n=1 Tax=Actinomadura barringtoniae TaxID=1427535 RepID=A0A939PN12_9ACTN|nr:esterase-like activity of phytase family protein [Actinomadura barringtoniae]MBO2452909.1 esterase-like activity of phytase family protein [Actinomadura barringtoniae]
MTDHTFLRRAGIAAIAAGAALTLAQPSFAAAPSHGSGHDKESGGTLPRIPLAQFQNKLLPGSIADDRGVALGGVGSDLFHDPGAPADEFWAITDRGPNGTVTVDGEERTTFPVATFDPTIVKIKVRKGAIKILRSLPITNAKGRPVTGLPNIDGREDAPYGVDGKTKLSYNPDGIDSEGLVRTENGEFWVAEEYGPSLLHLDKRGRVIERYVPQGWEGKGATYPIKATLPGILYSRAYNRGFEGLTVSPDGKSLYAAVQSPLANPDKKTYKASRNGRIVKFDLRSRKVTGEYVYRFEDVCTFDKPSCGSQNEMKISGLVAVDKNRLLVDERTDKVARIYTVDLRKATDINGSAWDDPKTSPSLEKSADVPAGVTALPKSLTVDLATVPGIPGKIEGIALSTRKTLAVINDNDFGLGTFGPDGRLIDSGIPTTLRFVPLPR